MKFEISRLAEGKEFIFSESWDAKALDLCLPGIAYNSLINVEAAVKKDGGVVKVDVTLGSSLSMTCDRCFKDFEKKLDQKFEIIYPIDIHERYIVLDDDIRSELFLSYPPKVLCREDCRGLCLHCGIDLNNGVCTCEDNRKKI